MHSQKMSIKSAGKYIDFLLRRKSKRNYGRMRFKNLSIGRSASKLIKKYKLYNSNRRNCKLKNISKSVKYNMLSNRKIEKVKNSLSFTRFYIKPSVYSKPRDLSSFIAKTIFSIDHYNVQKVESLLLEKNVIEGKHYFCKWIMEARELNRYIHEYNALVASINMKYPVIGKLLLQHLITDFWKLFNNSSDLFSISTPVLFIAELTCYRVVHECLILQMLMLLIETKQDDYIELVHLILLRCGQMLYKSFSRSISFILKILKNIIQLKNQEENFERVEFIYELIMEDYNNKFHCRLEVPEHFFFLLDNQITHVLSVDVKV